MPDLIPTNATPVTRRAWRRLVQVYGRRKARQTLEMIEGAAQLPRRRQLALVDEHCKRVYAGHSGTAQLVHQLLVRTLLDRGLPVEPT